MRIRALPVEIVFTALMVVILLAFSVLYDLPIRLPATGSAQFVGIHYLFPLLGLLIWSGCAALGTGKSRYRPLLIGLPCYAIVLFVHFHLKLWAQFINPLRYDQFYWSVDQHMRPLVDASMAARRALLPGVPYDANLYIIGFIALFYISFCYHALRTPQVFRRLLLAALFIQGLGALSYLVFPALGPFLYESGLNPFTTKTQQFMLHLHDTAAAAGPRWLAAHGGENLMTGLAAMPSLHVGTSFVFLWFALRHGRILLPTYIPLFGYIIVNAIASRWHYLIDLPAGLALAALCIWLAHRVTQEDDIGKARREENELVPALAGQAISARTASRYPHAPASPMSGARGCTGRSAA